MSWAQEKALAEAQAEVVVELLLRAEVETVVATEEHLRAVVETEGLVSPQDLGA